ncbi:chemotaxis protein CheA [Noviherbaspirillum sp. CPCC 100848]|uniref:Chemotaxis protein CheA n=1 Tax=Noviherbaspirillum album TaxID=3080276 RepID=A0ABU6JCM1_9BURK|nr:chemotaxis protein CheA [Noviherbaspirillum sp. CPCC 100848]MEC4721396.1 chemotaxis protein CheA [Noviherbaspirillum sp. CPCC 100848]
MTIDMSQFFQVFFDETEELLAEMEKLLLAIDIASPDEEDLNAIFRAAHSIKGGAGTFGLNDLTEVTHVLESLLDKIRKGEMALSAEHVDAFLMAKDVLKMQLDGHRLQTPVDQEAVADARMMLESLSEGEVPKAAPAASLEMAPRQPSAIIPSDGSARCFRIELPKIAERDVDALFAELGLLGQAARQTAPDGHTIFTLVGGSSRDEIISICSFIVDTDELKILEETPPQQMTAAELKAAQEEAQGYGFFDPIEPGEAQTDQQRAAAKAAQEAAQGYGFFEGFEPPVRKESQETEANAAASAAAAVLQQEAASAALVDKKAAAKRETDKANHNAETSSIRVGIEKVDQLINLVGELVITQAMIEQRTSTLDPMLHEKLLNSVSQLTRNTRDLQEAVMSIRMMPMDYVFSRFPRMVRDLASKLGKRIEFVTHGAATELDKGLIERIVDPLTHLVRNSIDHGIEMPEVRKAAGKSERGRLSLSAGHQGGNIVIEVTDDGGGLNRDKILAKARSQGLPVADTMTDADVWQLIFAPGFSTADAVTDVSGRGVGMDVVKRNITAMGGVVDIRSAKGFGTTISISLPLTLAILDGMSIKAGEEIYILPLGYVVESLQPEPADVKEISGQGRVVKVRGEYLPLIPLYQMFGIEPRFSDPSQGIVVILESEGRKAALFVDELVGQQQVVVKNLESNYRKVAGISGATILGDGGVSLIIDVAALLRSSRQLADESIFS